MAFEQIVAVFAPDFDAFAAWVREVCPKTVVHRARYVMDHAQLGVLDTGGPHQLVMLPLWHQHRMWAEPGHADSALWLENHHAWIVARPADLARIASGNAAGSEVPDREERTAGRACDPALDRFARELLGILDQFVLETPTGALRTTLSDCRDVIRLYRIRSREAA